MTQRRREVLFACRLKGRDEETALSRTKKQHFANDVPPACRLLFPQAGSGQNPLAKCGAIKERRTAFPLRTKNRQKTKNHRLTGKAPYKFQSPFLHQRVPCE